MNVNAISDVKKNDDIAIGTDGDSVLFEKVDVLGIEKTTVSAGGMPAMVDNSVLANRPKESVVKNIDDAFKPVPVQKMANVDNSNNIGMAWFIPSKTTPAILLYDWKTEEWTQVGYVLKIVQIL